MARYTHPLQIEDIKAINIEAASICSASCPFCSRSQKVRPYGNHLLGLKDIQALPQALFCSLRRVVFAGNFGDFACNRHMPEIVAYFFDRASRLFMGGETNGAVQSNDWWRRLGRVWRHGYVTFALDGLEDTHSLHRRGTDFNTVIENARAFIEGGGEAHWKFIVFAHNEDQIQQAAELARQTGFTRFYAISSRDYNDELRAPEKQPIAIKRDCFQAYTGSAAGPDQVLCKPFHKGAIYLAADGTVHPCCLAHLMYITEHNQQFRFVIPLIDKYLDRINIKTTPLARIIAGPYFEAVERCYGANPYCRIRCRPDKNLVRRDTVLCDLNFTIP